jgi:hypothetical protein
MRTLVDALIRFFTSLRLTVALLGFAIVVVFIGTLAQVDEGLYNAQARYFHQWLIFGVDVDGRNIPLLLPGGYLIGTLLVINLVASHIYRFQLSVKKIGIQIIHAGVILLLVGQLATDMLAHESQMHFFENETKAYSESWHANELAFTSAASGGGEEVVAIPQRLLTTGGEIKDPNLPFIIHVDTFWINSEPTFRAPMMQNGAPLTTNGVGDSFDFNPVAETKDPDAKNVPTAVIDLTGPQGPLGKWVVSGWSSDDNMVEVVRQNYAQAVGPQMAQNIAAKLTQLQAVTVDGKKYTFALRPERVYLPFSLELLKATHTVYEGTDIPKDFRSRVRLRNAQTQEDREVEISMNHPLRYDGLTFYQYQMDAGQAAQQAGRPPSSVLQVVHNPASLTPYIGCGMVAVGLTTQFLSHLIAFLTKRKKK